MLRDEGSGGVRPFAVLSEGAFATSHHAAGSRSSIHLSRDGRSDRAHVSGGLPHPAEAWLMRLHGLAGFGGLFLFGVLAAGHVPQGWRLAGRHRWARQRGTGVALCSLAGLLSLTGYLLYYYAPEPLRPTLGCAHAAIGIAMLGVVLGHRRRRNASTRAQQGQFLDERK